MNTLKQGANLISSVNNWLTSRKRNVSLTERANEFEAFKKAYVKCRKKQCDIIIKYLNNSANYPNKKQIYESSYGSYNDPLNSYKRIEPYDISNWMWINIHRTDNNDVSYFITLQPFEKYGVDKNGKLIYHHALFDRIGIYIGNEIKNSNLMCEKMIITDIDLPMNDNKLKDLLIILNKLGACYVANQIVTTASLRRMFPGRKFAIASE